MNKKFRIKKALLKEEINYINGYFSCINTLREYVKHSESSLELFPADNTEVVISKQSKI